jgi:hypothetical protein
MKRLIVLLSLLVAGCAANVTHELESSNSSGLRYYESAPYLLVYPNGKGGLVWQVLFLPDQSHVMVARPEVWGGRVQMAIKFQNGVLTNATTVGDTTVVPKAMIAAVQSALPLIAKAALEAPPEHLFPAPSIYKIVVRDDTISFIGGPGDNGIKVPLNTAAGQ